MLLAPAVASVSLAAHSQGAFDTPFESARVQEAVAIGTGNQAVVAVRAAIPFWQQLANKAPYLMAAQSAALPSLIIYDTGLEALPIGGYDGTTPSPTLAQLQADIRHGLFRIVWIGSATDPRLRWITTHCTHLTKRLYDCGTVPGRLQVPQPAPVGQSATQPCRWVSRSRCPAGPEPKSMTTTSLR